MRVIIAIFFFVSTFSVYAQVKLPKEDVSEKLLFASEKSYGIIIHSNGWGINYRYAKVLNVDNKLIYDGEFVTQRHPKEYRYSSNVRNDAKSFVYGKLNSVVSLRGGVGFQKTLFRKENSSSIEIRYTISGGPSFGFAKPVYLEVFAPSIDPDRVFSRVEKYNPYKHDLSNIIGRASFGRGLSQTKIYPGLYAKAAMQFEYSTEDEYLKFIELGSVVDIYPKPIPQMAYTKQYSWLLSVYVSFNFGNKNY
ncbi:MAG: hypothetical protein V4667_04670 [Bacteroidota bacterium]